MKKIALIFSICFFVCVGSAYWLFCFTRNDIRYWLGVYEFEEVLGLRPKITDSFHYIYYGFSIGFMRTELKGRKQYYYFEFPPFIANILNSGEVFICYRKNRGKQ